MFGNILSSVVKIVTLPVDAANASIDLITGGDGSKESRTETPIIGDAEKIRDAIAKALRDCDE